MFSLICASALGQLPYYLLAFVLLMVMVTVHEFGHYLAGKLLHFKINEFSVGMGPKIVSKKNKSDETVSLRVFPVGGYCAFEGEGGEDDSPEAFNKQKPWKRIIVLFAGVFFNFVSAILIACILLGISGTPAIKVDKTCPSADGITVSRFNADDVFYSVDGRRVFFVNDVTDHSADGKAHDYVVIRDGVKVTLSDVTTSTFVSTDEDGKQSEFTGYGVKFTSDFLRDGFFGTIGNAFAYVFAMARLILVTLGGLFTGKVAIAELGGPITTIKVTSEVVSYGFIYVLRLFVFMSVNLAVFNLVPFPALDGCQIVFTAVEWIIGKPINPKITNIINTVGLVVLLAFVVFVDLIKIWI